MHKLCGYFQKKKDFQTIGSIEEYERLALIEEAQAEMLEDEKEKFKKQSLDSKSSKALDNRTVS